MIKLNETELLLLYDKIMKHKAMGNCSGKTKNITDDEISFILIMYKHVHGNIDRLKKMLPYHRATIDKYCKIYNCVPQGKRKDLWKENVTVTEKRKSIKSNVRKQLLKTLKDLWIKTDKEYFKAMYNEWDTTYIRELRGIKRGVELALDSLTK